MPVSEDSGPELRAFVAVTARQDLLERAGFRQRPDRLDTDRHDLDAELRVDGGEHGVELTIGRMRREQRSLDVNDAREDALELQSLAIPEPAKLREELGRSSELIVSLVCRDATHIAKRVALLDER